MNIAKTLARMKNQIVSQREAIKSLEERLKEARPVRIRRSRLSKGEQDALMRVFRTQLNEDDWLFIADENVDLEFKDIPREFRTVAVLTVWLEWDLGRMDRIPREYWTDELKRNAHHLLTAAIAGAETEKALAVMDAVIKEKVPR